MFPIPAQLCRLHLYCAGKVQRKAIVRSAGSCLAHIFYYILYGHDMFSRSCTILLKYQSIYGQEGGGTQSDATCGHLHDRGNNIFALFCVPYRPSSNQPATSGVIK